VRYIGNKRKLLEFIENSIVTQVGNLEDKVFCDLFSGTTTVARHFKKKCKKVISNDLERYSYVLAKNYLENNSPIDYHEMISELNSLEGKEGIFTKNLSPFGDCERKFFTVKNAKKIDAIRSKIEEWKVNDKISDGQYFFLLASLLESVDKHANTTGVYGAFLKEFDKKSINLFVLEEAKFDIGLSSGEVFHGDANELLPNLTGDILYLDPPYNARQYGANYHILNYICSNAINIKLDKEGKESKTGLPSDYNKSPYSTKAGVKKAFEDLISKSSGFKWVFLSYNDEGLLSLDEIKDIFEKHGKYYLTNTAHLRYNSSKNKSSKKHTIEYLHILERG
jgi:adenine-specific DNA-methyltransferase